jgi:hypothetical protein
MSSFAKSTQLIGRNAEYYVADVTPSGQLKTINDASDTLLTNINNNIQDVETLLISTNALLTSIGGFVNDVETLIGTTNTNLTTINDHVDGLETLIGTTNTNLETIETTNNAIQIAVEALTDLAEFWNSTPIHKCYDQSTTAASSAANIWSPASGYGIVLCDFNLSVDSDTFVEIFENSDTTANKIYQGYLGAKMNLVCNFKKPLKLAINNSLKFSNTPTSKLSIVASGYEYQ